jgi:hypothetical protein
MKRFGAVVLFAGAVLLSTHILAPAEPPPAPSSLPAADLAAVAQAAPLAAQLDAQATRLRERLSSPPPYSEPSRDPFRFRSAAPKRTTKPAPKTPPAEPAAPAPPLPHVVAIATNTVDGAVVHTAVIGLDATVKMVRPGDTFLNFSIRSVAPDGVELVDPATDQTFRISLQ